MFQVFQEAHLARLAAGRQDAQPAPSEAPKARRAPKAAPAPTEAQPAPQAPPTSAPEPSLPCCGARAASGIHKSDCPVAYPKPAPEKTPPATEEPAPPAAPTVEDVRSAFLGYASRKGRDAAVALLATFGAAKVAEVPTAQFGALVAACKGA